MQPRPRASASWVPVVLVLGMAAALVALAGLQYRWIARVSEAERDRLKTTLDASAGRFCSDVDHEVARVQQAFQSKDDVPEAELASDLAERLARWRATAPAPKLVRELLVVTRFGRGEIALQRLDETSRRLVDVASEAGLESVREVFEARGKVPALDGRLPGVVIPIRAPRPPKGGEGDRRPPRDAEREAGDERRPPRQHVVVRLDRGFLQKEMIPVRAEREFGGPGGLAYAVSVVVAERPDDVLFQGGPRVSTRAGEPDDAIRRFFALQRPGDEPEPGKWILSVRHPSGSLEDAVAGARRRNLAVSVGILALLAATLAVLVATTRRAQRLARQQMEFVAGVSHELKTPLTAMRSAGQNLADGIVDSPEKVRNYGALIEREGRRLTEMVGRVLTFAGIQSGVQTFRMESLDVAALVDGVLADCRWVLDEKRVAVERTVEDGLPRVRGDAAALRQALANLVDNALKYGGTAGWIGVDARCVAAPQGPEVVVSVADRGLGIKHSDLPRLFEPFFRGADASAAGITGSGLGLAVVRHIVEAHRGRVTVDSAPGKGSAFAIHLPAAPAPGEDA